jgi:hypothetical protein
MGGVPCQDFLFLRATGARSVDILITSAFEQTVLLPAAPLGGTHSLLLLLLLLLLLHPTANPGGSLLD